MDVSRARGATGRVVGIEAEARNLVAVGTGEAEGRAELLLWNGAYSSVTSGPLLDTRVAGIFGPAMAPYVFPAGTELRLARPRVVDGGTADPMTALAATVHDAGGALQDGAELRFTYAGDPVPSVCVTSGGGCWAVQTQPVTAAPARIHVAVLLDLNANGLADPGEPVRTAAYTTPSTQRVRATGLVRFAGLGTFPLRLLAGAFRGRVGGTLLLGPKDDPLARTQTFTSARFAAHSVALRAAGFTLTLVQPRTVTLQTRAGILRGRLVRGSIVFPR
jgi:hypothetical protein